MGTNGSGVGRRQLLRGIGVTALVATAGVAVLAGCAEQRRDPVREHHIRPEGLPPVNGYSHAVAFTGRMVAVSGQVPLDGQGTLVGQHDVQAQLRQVFTNLKTALAAAGAGMEHVVKLTVYLTDLRDLDAFRRVRDEFLVQAAPPATSLVQVSGLVNPAFRVEIDALAAV